MAWGDKIGEFNLQQGENVEVSVDLESREYNGRWYTDVKAWKVSKDGMSANNEPTYGNQDSNQNKVSLEEDDIPFQHYNMLNTNEQYHIDMITNRIFWNPFGTQKTKGSA